MFKKLMDRLTIFYDKDSHYGQYCIKLTPNEIREWSEDCEKRVEKVLRKCNVLADINVGDLAKLICKEMVD